MECDVFVDLMAGYFWVMNSRNEIANYVVDSLPHIPMFFGLTCSLQNLKQISFQTVALKVINPDNTSMCIKTITKHLCQMFQQERMIYRSFTEDASIRNELQVRMYGKKARYVICFYCILSLVRIAKCSVLPIPLTLTEDLLRDYSERQHICEVYPELFQEDLGIPNEWK